MKFSGVPLFTEHENLGTNKQGQILPRVKAPVYLVIHMCPMVKARESVERRAKLAVRPLKFIYPQKTHVLLIKRSLEIQYPMGFGS